MFNKQPSNTTPFDIFDIAYIERVAMGAVAPDKIPTEAENQEKLALLNRYLQENPRGRIIGTERSFSLIRIGEHQVVLESVVYHVGFKRKPYATKKQPEAPIVTTAPK